ncbi:hypothetical protein [Cellulomonas sp. HZM]|uniref:hypothetical protein n=1 Tax=Cellulomonas sp. HZM TaxID=1454010 RepID=UPI00068CE4EF|nr:hypothetical protein [Cellulomonas sp. HZM]
MVAEDLGREFEQRALAVARAKHDPSGLQGAVEFEGAEHDGAFIDENSINVYEFTTLRTKDKANKDGGKLARLIKHLLSDAKNRYKSATGYFVTQQEPEIEQKKAIDAIARAHGVTLHCLSFLTLQKSLVDVEGYIALRRNAPFGSASALLTSTPTPTRSYVEPTLNLASTGEATKVNDVVREVERGARLVVTGDFGIGKSAALKEMFGRLRSAYFQKPNERRFPIHVNIRDCVGLRSPREILQRHAEEIGFAGSNGLIAAWRAGHADLLLDGFDELVPTRWVGTARDLKAIRWQTLAPVRQLVADTPPNASVVISGRPQYFASQKELYDTLGMPTCVHFELLDFDDKQVEALIGDVDLPAWLPSRPLFVEYLAQTPDVMSSELLGAVERGRGWRRLIRLVSEREAGRVTSIPAETFESLVARIALVAREDSDGRGPISLESMRRAFYDICGYEAEEEGVQALLRLPGLARSNGSGTEEMRTFVDSDFADAAFAIDLSRYLAAPYAEHPMRSRARWSTTSSALVAEVAADELISGKFDGSAIAACMQARSNEGLYDAILFDAASVLALVPSAREVRPSPFLADLLIERLELADEDAALGDATLSGCLIETLDVSEIVEGTSFPTFQNCDIGTVEGWRSIPESLAGHFSNCTIHAFEGAERTTAGLLRQDLPNPHRVALTILKKVYVQAGGGRQLPALSRGLPLELRPLVDEVVQQLSGLGYLELADGRGVVVVRPVRRARRDVLAILEAPATIGMAMGAQGG